MLATYTEIQITYIQSPESMKLNSEIYPQIMDIICSDMHAETLHLCKSITRL